MNGTLKKRDECASNITYNETVVPDSVDWGKMGCVTGIKNQVM